MLVLLTIYSLALPFIFAEGGAASAIGATLAGNATVYPILMFSYLKLRQGTTVRMQNRQEEKEINYINKVGDAVANYRVVCDYFRRPKVAAQIEEAIDAYNVAVANVHAVR